MVRGCRQALTQLRAQVIPQPAFLKRGQCSNCAEAKRRSILILQVQADKADAVLAPLPEGEPLHSDSDYTLYTEIVIIR